MDIPDRDPVGEDFEQRRGDEEDAGRSDGEDAEGEANYTQLDDRERRPRKSTRSGMNVRNKVLMAGTAMAVMLNSRNERLNHFQNMVSIDSSEGACFGGTY